MPPANGLELSPSLLSPSNVQDLHAEANVNVGDSGMPTFVNFFRSTAVDVLTSMGLTKGGRQMLSILGDRTEGISGVLKPVSGWLLATTRGWAQPNLDMKTSTLNPQPGTSTLY